MEERIVQPWKHVRRVMTPAGPHATGRSRRVAQPLTPLKRGWAPNARRRRRRPARSPPSDLPVLGGVRMVRWCSKRGRCALARERKLNVRGHDCPPLGQRRRKLRRHALCRHTLQRRARGECGQAGDAATSMRQETARACVQRAVCGVGVGVHAHAHLIREVLIDTTSPAQPTVEPLDAPARVRLHAMRCCKLLFSRGTLLQVVVCSRRLSRSMLLRAPPPPPPPPLPACPALAARRHATRHAAQSRRQGSAALTARAVARRSAGGWERVRLWPEGSQG
jgi:hypothetical protein